MPKLKDIKSKVNILDIVSLFEDIEYKGNFKYIRCINHEDSEPSMSISEDLQIVKCFSCGFNADVIGFLNKKGYSFKDSVKILKGELKIDGLKIERGSHTERNEIKSQWELVTAYESCDTIADNIFKRLPDNVYTYFTRDGKLYGYMCRFDMKGDTSSKVILPLARFVCTKTGYENYDWSSKKGVGRFNTVGDVVWRWKGFGDNRPLYNLDLLEAFKTSKVLLVEGEKVANHVQKLFDPTELIVTTWSGGTNASNKTDFEPLSGRDVCMVPDIDYLKKGLDGTVKPYIEQPSQKCFYEIGDKIIDDVGSLSITLVDDCENYFCGDDLADFAFNRKDVISYIKKYIIKLK